MEECPYCGAQNEEGTVQCGTCMAILQEVDEEQMEQFEAVAAKAEEAQTKTKECPKCQTRNPMKARRCVECGTQLEDDVVVADQSAWEYGTWAVLGGAGGLIFLVFVFAIWLGSGPPERIYVKAPVGTVLKFSASSIKRNKTKRAETWEKELQDQYVVWKAMAVKIDGSTVEFAVSSAARKKKKGEIQVEFSDDFPDEMKVGKDYAFDAKLISYNEDGFNFKLEDGKKPEPK